MPIGKDGPEPIRVSLSLDDPALVAWSSENARIYFQLMGIDPGEHLVGDVSIEEARDAVFTAVKGMASIVSGESNSVLRAREVQMATVGRTLRPKVIRMGLSQEMVIHAIAQFAKAVERLGKLGADRVAWS